MFEHVTAQDVDEQSGGDHKPEGRQVVGTEQHQHAVAAS